MRDSIFQCNAGINTASVLADGAYLRLSQYTGQLPPGTSIKTISLISGIMSLNRIRNRQLDRKGECADCKMFRYCEGNGMHLYDDKGNLLLCHYKG